MIIQSIRGWSWMVFKAPSKAMHSVLGAAELTWRQAGALWPHPFFLAGLGGGSASGKTTVATMIIEALDVPWVVLLSMDSFYKVRPCGPMGKRGGDEAASSCFPLAPWRWGRRRCGVAVGRW